MPPRKRIKKEEPYSPTKDMAEYTRLTCERKIKEDEVRSRVVLYKCLKVGVIGAEWARKEHFQRLDEYQAAEVFKRKNEIRAIDREMNKIDKRIRTKWE